MWTATLLYKTERTDGGIDFNVNFTDGSSKFQKMYTFFGEFDLSETVRQEIARITKLRSKTVSIGEIIPAPDPGNVVNATAIDIQKLRKMVEAVRLGLLSEDEIVAQREKVKLNPDFLDLV